LHPSHKFGEASDPRPEGKPGPKSTRVDRHTSTTSGRTARTREGQGGGATAARPPVRTHNSSCRCIQPVDRQGHLATLTTDFHLVTVHRWSFRFNTHDGANLLKYLRIAPVSPTTPTLLARPHPLCRDLLPRIVVTEPRHPLASQRGCTSGSEPHQIPA
jgi:hypothetical protein